MNERAVIAMLGGTGSEGSGLAFRWAWSGHEVVIGSRSALFFTRDRFRT